MGLLMSLLGGGAGVLARLLPEIFQIFTHKQDQAHELAMTQLQLEIDKARATQQIDLAHAQADAQQQVDQMKAYIEAIKTQGAITGVKWIDAVNQSVRPAITYWWMLLFTLWKINQIYLHGLTWTDNDWGILSMITGFWFVDRAIRYNKGQITT